MKNSLFVKDDVSAGHGKTPAPPRATVLFFRKIFFYFLLLFSSRSRSTTFFFLHRSGYFVFFVSFVWQLDGERMSVIQ
jgi:hypothetical protein